jgi:hypothetical protein
LYKNVIICRDHNTDVLKDTRKSAYLKNLLFSYNLHLPSFQATHIVVSSQTLLDLIIVDDPSKVEDFGQESVKFLSEHDLVYVNYIFNTPPYKPPEICFRDLAKIDYVMFETDWNSLSWEDFFSTRDVNEKVAIVNSQLTCLLDRHAPIKKIKIRRNPAPWLSQEIKNAMSHRDSLRRHFRRTRSVQKYHEYKVSRNKVKQMQHNAKVNYFLPAY